MAQAVTPPPDGGYAGGNTRNQNALFRITTGEFNTAVGFFALITTPPGFNTALGAGTLLRTQ